MKNTPDSAPSSSAPSDVLATAIKFAAEQVAPSAAQWEREHTHPRHMVTHAATNRLCGLLVPTELGGLGLSAVHAAEVMAAIATADMGFAFSLVCHNNLAAAIAKRGSPEHKAKYLPLLLDGSMLGAFLLTEPDAGSDAGAISTSAQPTDSRRWVINGDKAWVTNASHAQLLNVYAQTDPEAGHNGIGAFLVEAAASGVSRTEPYEMLGAHSTGTGGISFSNVSVDDSSLFIEPGSAFKAAMEAIDLARTLVAAMCTAMLRHGLEVAVGYVSNRQAFGLPLSDRQGLRWMLADVATDIEAAEGLWRSAAHGLSESSPDVAIRAAHAKKFATRVALSGLAQCMQALGANGFRQDFPLARHLAAAKMAHYLDGTTEIQNLVIARSLFAAQPNPQ